MKNVILTITIIIISTIMFGCNYISGSETPPGDIHKFKPVIYLNKIAKFSGKDAKLVSIKTDYVLNTGIMDLDPGYTNSAEYEFIITENGEEELTDPPKQPPGMGKSSYKYGWSTVTVQNENNVDYSRPGHESYAVDRGMRRFVKPFDNDLNQYVIPKPKCNFKKIWKNAIKAGASKKYAASITYNREGYLFESKGERFTLKFDLNCKLSDNSKWH